MSEIKSSVKLDPNKNPCELCGRDVFEESRMVVEILNRARLLMLVSFIIGTIIGFFVGFVVR